MAEYAETCEPGVEATSGSKYVKYMSRFDFRLPAKLFSSVGKPFADVAVCALALLQGGDNGGDAVPAEVD